MIIGVGVDIIEINRVVRASNKQRFLSHCFTDSEIELCNTDKIKFASNFAVKEAIAKALGTGFSIFSPCDIEVLRQKNGKPYAILYREALLLSEKLKVNYIHISISHNKSDVVAYVVLEGGLNEN